MFSLVYMILFTGAEEGRGGTSCRSCLERARYILSRGGREEVQANRPGGGSTLSRSTFLGKGGVPRRSDYPLPPARVLWVVVGSAP